MESIESIARITNIIYPILGSKAWKSIVWNFPKSPKMIFHPKVAIVFLRNCFLDIRFGYFVVLQSQKTLAGNASAAVGIGLRVKS